VIVLVFDVTNRASFERIRSNWAGPDNMWALEKGILVGNKCDLELRRSVNSSEARPNKSEACVFSVSNPRGGVVTT
jgi:hypothetical protein